MAPSREQFEWQLRTCSLPLGVRTAVMGILNLTPDSFSDGGSYSSVPQAVESALRMLDAGAAIIDLGGESTRPGSAAATDQAVSEQEEQGRVLPVLEAILGARPDAVISVDTYRAPTARRALEAGAEIVNDVSGGLWDSEMIPLLAATRCGVVAMHTRGLPSEWSSQSRLGDAEVLPLVLQGLAERAEALLSAGVARQRIVLDPGFGFGKRGQENWALLAGYARLAEPGYPTLTGLSRKGFLSSAAGEISDRDLDAATAAANLAAVLAGAHIVRVHNVSQTMAAVRMADHILAHAGVEWFSALTDGLKCQTLRS